jgi:predicted metal-binding membrane protein
VASWWLMTGLMMLPVIWPWLRTLHGLSAGGGGPSAFPATAVAAFAGGYLLVWLGFGIGAAALQRFLAPHGSAGWAVRGGVLAVAGLYQLTPVKAACLRHCRSPLSVLLSRWPLGRAGAGRLGAEHGVFCLGCCWALMLVGVGAGSVGWSWMVALTGLVAVEKLASAGPAVGRWAGVGLLGLAALEAGRGL